MRSTSMARGGLYGRLAPYARAVKVRAQMLIGLAVVVVFAYRWLTTGHAQWDTIAHIALDVVSTGLAVSAAVELFYTLFTPSLDEALDPLILGVSAFALAKISEFGELTTAVATPVLLLTVAIGVLFLARRLLPHADQTAADAVPAADPYPVEDVFTLPGRTGPVDRAAIFGAALAAVIVLAVGQGPWTPLGTVIGVVLLLVVAGFYSPRGASAREALAVGAVVAACATVALAWPLQWVLARWQPLGVHAVADCTKVGDEALSRAIRYPDKMPLDEWRRQVTGNCQGDETTGRLWLVAVPSLLVAVPMIWVLGRRLTEEGDEGEGDLGDLGGPGAVSPQLFDDETRRLPDLGAGTETR